MSRTKPNSSISPIAIAVAIAAAAAGTGVLTQGIDSGLVGRSGARAVAFILGATITALGVSLLVRGMRLRWRARAARIASLLPRLARPRFSGARRPFGEDEFEDGFLNDDFATGDDLSDGFPSAPAEIRAATRALLVSLEEELRREGRRPRRAGRPACRRARLRVIGRSEPKRRRVRQRPAAIPS